MIAEESWAVIDREAEARGLTVVHAPWHPVPDYRIWKTGTLLSRNDEYPSGLVIVNEKGKPTPYG